MADCEHEYTEVLLDDPGSVGMEDWVCRLCGDQIGEAEATMHFREKADRLQSLIDQHNARMEEMCGDCPQRQKGRQCLDCMRHYRIEEEG